MLSLLRNRYTDQSTTGTLLINDEFFCWTLEDRDHDGPKIPGETCIPAGVYKVVIDWSNRFQRQMPHILDVPDFEGIRIHAGNTDKDTAGCVLVGYSRAQDFVGDSRHAFNDLFEHMDVAIHLGEPVYINVMKNPGATYATSASP